MSERPPKAMRADAVRNRAKILDAARDQITRHGPDVGMDEIAAAAGVAVGTLYGHFPTKVHLVASVVSEFFAQVADRSEVAARAVKDGSPAFGELAALLHDVAVATSTNQAAKAAAGALDAGGSDSEDLQRAMVALQSIIDRARSDGTIRQNLAVDDLYLLVSSIPAGQAAETLDRWIDLVLHGIAVEPRSSGTSQAAER
ncbi:AcrR family transcriptional regulator [Microbacterium resistens]|uniref:AcrR family transcriptional regulator n=1 Tax=Microbacterium resistens TaxID=156977 RepID=A0ABU1SFW3_9MICO|nr:TetR family transcriptional regulator [Microbacterium resistens]MDR6868499.1 AcrR family transcriptional regulator [Microbacterium resistens]